MSQELGVEVQNSDIGAIHRLNAREGKIPGIVVRLNNQDLKPDLIRQSKRVKLSCGTSKIFIDEHLTRKNADMMKRAKQLVKVGVIRYAWWRNGKVLIREVEDGPVIRVEELSQLPQSPPELQPLSTGKKKEQTTPNSQYNFGHPSTKVQEKTQGKNGRNNTVSQTTKQQSIEKHLQRFTRSTAKNTAPGDLERSRSK